jgi:hypothetical protein
MMTVNFKGYCSETRVMTEDNLASGIRKVTEPEKGEILEVIEAAQRETPQWRLPFVWGVMYNGITSYAIGSKHNEPWNYSGHIRELLDKVEVVCVEVTPDTLPYNPTTLLQEELTEKIETFLENAEPTISRRVQNIINRIQPPEQGKYSGVDGNILNCVQQQTVHAMEKSEERHEQVKAALEKISMGLLETSISSNIV